MSAPMPTETEVQRRYYAETAHAYNAMHVTEGHEHDFALCLMLSMLDFHGIRSILDIGSGTGRAILQIRKARPDILVRGIEPVPELREVGYKSGIDREQLVDGNALALDFADRSFDLVCEFGVLHHIRQPEKVVAEMLRVSRKAIFLSDCNNFGQGGSVARGMKQLLNALRLWRLADFIKTRGKGYTISAGDGLAYSYSVFNNYRQIRARCSRVHLLNTTDAGVNPYRSASHVALFGIF